MLHMLFSSKFDGFVTWNALILETFWFCKIVRAYRPLFLPTVNKSTDSDLRYQVLCFFISKEKKLLFPQKILYWIRQMPLPVSGNYYCPNFSAWFHYIFSASWGKKEQVLLTFYDIIYTCSSIIAAFPG